MNRPICQFCGKPLPKYTYSATIEEGAEEPTTIYGRTVKAVVRRKKLTWYDPPKIRLSLWCGDFGRYGDGFFCGLTCGYRFACKVWRIVRDKARQEEET